MTKHAKDETNPPATEEAGKEDGSLISVAKTLGRAAGRIAAKTGLDHAEAPALLRAPAVKRGKLVSKNKTRVPRRQKKAQQKSVR